MIKYLCLLVCFLSILLIGAETTCVMCQYRIGGICLGVDAETNTAYGPCCENINAVCGPLTPGIGRHCIQISLSDISPTPTPTPY